MRADTKLSTKGVIEIRHISEPGVEGNIKHAPRLQYETCRRPPQPSAENILVRGETSELVKYAKEVIAAKFRFSRKGDKPAVGIRMTLDLSNDSDYRPANDVRTVAEVLRHLAFWNHYVADSARGEKYNDTANELPKDKYLTKPQIIRTLKQGAADAASVFRELVWPQSGNGGNAGYVHRAQLRALRPACRVYAAE